MKQFSAIGYFFGKKLEHELNVPIGLISSSWGGTPAEVWTPKASIDNDAVLKEAATRIPVAYPGWPLLPGKTYNAMIYPITNFSIAGVLWYQGETNVETYSTYNKLLSTMVGDWRKAWHKDFPFYFVQIAPFAYGNNYNGALLREEQTKVLHVANTGMVVISDLVADVNDIHPINKIDVALRLANYALAETYGKTALPHKSPLYKSMKVEKGKIRIYFDNVTKGLTTKNGAPTEFYIAGDDKKFVPATAKIDGNTVIVWSKEVKNPIAVRFGFSNVAMPNLFSSEGLPVNLFRTDDWSF
jgi:sialate O-acetylesterase